MDVIGNYQGLSNLRSSLITVSLPTPEGPEIIANKGIAGLVSGISVIYHHKTRYISQGFIFFLYCRPNLSLNSSDGYLAYQRTFAPFRHQRWASRSVDL